MLLPGQLQKQTFGERGGAYARGLQTLQRLQSLGDKHRGNLQFFQARQVLGGEIAVLVHQLRHVFGQGQQRLGQTLPVQLVTEEGGQALCFPIHDAPLRVSGFAVGKGGAVYAAVQPVGLLAQFLIGLPQGGGVFLLQHRIFLRDPVQVLQQLLGVHLQDFHGLQELRCQLQLLPQIGL